MPEDGCLPRITTALDDVAKPLANPAFQTIVQDTLRKIIPAEAFSYTRSPEQFLDLLPIFTHTPIGYAPATISFYLITPYQNDCFKFFLEMIRYWLIPGQKLNIVLFHAIEFMMPDISQKTFMLSEILVHVDNAADLSVLKHNLPAMAKEIKLGLCSPYNARKILEIKGLSTDQKLAHVLEHIQSIASRRPLDFDSDVFTELQHILLNCRDDFKTIRECGHLSRIILIQHLFRKNLRKVVKQTPEKRHLNLKIFKCKLSTPGKPKSVLGIIVGINFLADKEIFEEKHLLKSVQSFMPNIHAVEGSFIANRKGSDAICTLYLEVAKDDGMEFTAEEINRLRRELPNDLKDRIEHMMHPIFMPRNEEEIMRNILSLANQLKMVKDMPQIFITFDEQTHFNLFFTVILVRVLRPNSCKLEEVFEKANTFLEYIHDSTRIVGYLRKKHPKEATVFRVELPKEMFLRADHSIDLYKARQTVVAELQRILGGVRDYNGGMISKQSESLLRLRTLLAEAGSYNDFLLENFFYSLTPSIMRNVLEPQALRTLFLMLLNMLETGIPDHQNLAVQFYRELDAVYVMIAAANHGIKDAVNAALNKLNVGTTELASIYVNTSDMPCLGYIYNCDDPYKQEHFCQTISLVTDAWVSSVQESLVPYHV
jgi:hypothetical protein